MDILKDLKIEWHKVTWYSKLMAFIVILVTYAFAFMLGILYERIRIETALQMVPYIIQE